MARNCGDDGGSRCKHLCSQDNMELSSYAIYGNGLGFKVMAYAEVVGSSIRFPGVVVKEPQNCVRKNRVRPPHILVPVGTLG